jgi:hydroxymethylpyrimidine/phosphomethylpyrimidine kinase
MMSMPIVLSIAGTDPTAGAGIQADIKTISATRAYAASVITAVLAQNTQGVQVIHALPDEFVRQQLQSVLSDFKISAVKVGMLHEPAVIDAVFSELKPLQSLPIVLDPVLFASSGTPLLGTQALSYLKERIKNQVYLITPNLVEAEFLSGLSIATPSQMQSAAHALGQELSMNVLIKGGHLAGEEAMDVLYVAQHERCHWFCAPRIETKNTHGTGCTLSSALASYLAQGFSLLDAMGLAKTYISQALLSGAGWELGKGRGPLDHFHVLRNRL